MRVVLFYFWRARLTRDLKFGNDLEISFSSETKNFYTLSSFVRKRDKEIHLSTSI